MPYALLGLVASLALATYHGASADATLRSKIAVAAAELVALGIWFRRPRWIIASILLQVAVSVYVLIYLKVHADDASRTS